MPPEEWKVIEAFPRYSVSSYGRVRNDDTGRILTQRQNQSSVAYVGLVRGRKQVVRATALLVCLAFKPKRFEAFDTPINLDGDRMNNHVDNLMWRPYWFARKYNRQFVEPYANPLRGPIVDTDTGETWDNSFDCAVANGLLESDVVLSIANRTVVWPTYQTLQLVE